MSTIDIAAYFVTFQQDDINKMLEERSRALEVHFDECLAEQRLKQQVLVPLCISTTCTHILDAHLFMAVICVQTVCVSQTEPTYS